VSQGTSPFPISDDPASGTAGLGGERPDRRHSLARRLRNVIIAIIVPILAVWLVLYVTKGRFLKGTFERVATSLLQRKVSVDSGFELYFNPIEIRFAADGLHVANPIWASKPDLFSATHVDADIAPLSLIFGRRHMRSLNMTNGAIDAEWDAAHVTNTWTFGSNTNGKPFELPIIDRASLSASTVRFKDPRLRFLADLSLHSIASRNARIGGAVRLDGHGRLRDTPFTLTGALQSPDATVARGRNQLTLKVRAAENIIDIAGNLPSLADVENVPLAVRARGKDVDDLLRIIDVVVPETRAYVLKATLIKSGTDYSFSNMSGRFGDSDIAGKFTVHDRQTRVRLDAVLFSRSLDIIDAAPFIGYSPDIVAEKGAIAAAAETGAAPANLIPNAPIPVERMQSFDATLHYRIGAIRSRHLPISNVDLNLSLDHGMLKLDPLRFAMSKGEVIATMAFNARVHPVRATYDIRLTPTPMGSLLSGFGVAESGTTGTIHGRMELQGVGDTLHDSLSSANGRIAFIIPAGTLSQRNVQLSELDIGVFAQRLFQHKLKEPVAINCGLVAFTVRNGTAAADPILIDTEKNVIAGNGSFNFRNEAIDLSVKADGKKFSLFSGQSPIRLGGRFSSPSINPLSPALIGRAGAAVALGVVGTPVASMLAFVDLGGGKAAACGPVLAGATANAQRTTKGKPRNDVGTGTPGVRATHKKLFGLF
jgi:uncharacterized protein involved in outer membrane biogenesis